ncbi:hypothetical protein [Chlorobium phaeovibrioides]|nr:hypothetical protein [Chlorobium phaeovibrioides]
MRTLITLLCNSITIIYGHGAADLLEGTWFQGLSERFSVSS